MTSASEIKIGSLLTRDEFRALSTCNDTLAFVHLFVRIAVHAGLLWLMAHSWLTGKPLLSLAALYLNGVLWQFLGYAGIGHELFHKKVFSNKNANSFLYRLFSYFTWNNPSYFEKSHQFHHASTFHEDDREIYRDFPLNVAGAARLLLLDYTSLFKRIAYAVANTSGYEVYFSGGIRLKKMRPDHEARRDAALMLFANTFVLTIFYLATKSIPLTAMFFLTPFIGHLPNRVLALAQHSGLDDHKDDGALLFSRTLNLPRPIAFFYANMNYHAEHHLLPSVPYYNLPRLHSILTEKLKMDREEEHLGYLFSRTFWKNVNTTSKEHTEAIAPQQ
jgi:fatty acid desaturase